MVFLQLFARAANATDSEAPSVEESSDAHIQAIAIVTFLVVLSSTRYLLMHEDRLQAVRGEHPVSLSNLNNACMYKEVFLNYLGAALLDPVLAIGGMQEYKVYELVVNIFTLGSICWWIWMITDAFDYTNVSQAYFYIAKLQPVADADPQNNAWLRMKSRKQDQADQRQALGGSVQRDVALWFAFASIGVAWLPGPVTHRDVMHAYVIIIMWAVVHHSCRQAATWSASYPLTFIFPSVALMPVEYCMPLMDTLDFVEDFEGVALYREFVKHRTGIELVLLS